MLPLVITAVPSFILQVMYYIFIQLDAVDFNVSLILHNYRPQMAQTSNQQHLPVGVAQPSNSTTSATIQHGLICFRAFPSPTNCLLLSKACLWISLGQTFLLEACSPPKPNLVLPHIYNVCHLCTDLLILFEVMGQQLLRSIITAYLLLTTVVIKLDGLPCLPLLPT